MAKIDVESTGDTYDSFIEIEMNSKHPHNTMANIGAIVITDLIRGGSLAHKLNCVLGIYQRYVGSRVYVHKSTLIYEQTSCDSNWATFHSLGNLSMISGEIKSTLDIYL